MVVQLRMKMRNILENIIEVNVKVVVVKEKIIPSAVIVIKLIHYLSSHLSFLKMF